MRLDPCRKKYFFFLINFTRISFTGRAGVSRIAVKANADAGWAGPGGLRAGPERPHKGVSCRYGQGTPHNGTG